MWIGLDGIGQELYGYLPGAVDGLDFRTIDARNQQQICEYIEIGFGELQLLVIMIVDYQSDARIRRKNNQSNFMFYIDLLGEE